MEFNLKLDYVVRSADKEVDPNVRDPRRISELMIRRAIEARFAAGIKDRDLLKLAGHVSRETTRALNESDDTIELNLSQLGFVLESLKEWSVPPIFAPWFDDFFDHLEATIKTARDAEKAKRNGGATKPEEAVRAAS